MRFFNTSKKLERINKFKIGLSCPDSYKKIFHESKCLLPVSVGQTVHEGDQFSETIQLVNERFLSWSLLIDDTLQRHTLMINHDLSEEEAYKLSKTLGDEWIERNFSYLGRLLDDSNTHKQFEVIRWDYWVHHEKYKFHHDLIKNEYNSNVDYQVSIDNTVAEFIRRHKNRLTDPHLFNEHKAQTLCRDYLFEECAALCLWTEGGYQFEVYPGPRNEAMSKTHSLFVAPKYPNMLSPVRVKIKNKKSNSNEKKHGDESELIMDSFHSESSNVSIAGNVNAVF